MWFRVRHGLPKPTPKGAGLGWPPGAEKGLDARRDAGNGMAGLSTVNQLPFCLVRHKDGRKKIHSAQPADDAGCGEWMLGLPSTSAATRSIKLCTQRLIHRSQISQKSPPSASRLGNRLALDERQCPLEAVEAFIVRLGRVWQWWPGRGCGGPGRARFAHRCSPWDRLRTVAISRRRPARLSV